MAAAAGKDVAEKAKAKDALTRKKKASATVVSAINKASNAGNAKALVAAAVLEKGDGADQLEE